MGRRTRYNTSNISTSTTNSNVTHEQRSASAQQSSQPRDSVNTGAQQHPLLRFFGNVVAGGHNTLASYNVLDDRSSVHKRDKALQELYIEGVFKGDYDEAWGETTRRAEEEPGKLVGEIATEVGVNIATMGAASAVKGAVTGIKAGKIGARVLGSSFKNDMAYERFNVVRNRHAKPVQRVVKKGKVYTIYEDKIDVKKAGISDITENQLQKLTRRFTKNYKTTRGKDTSGELYHSSGYARIGGGSGLSTDQNKTISYMYPKGRPVDQDVARFMKDKTEPITKEELGIITKQETIYNLPKTSPLEKIISGGQSGVDMAGVKTAHMRGIKVGGTVPKGGKQEVETLMPEQMKIYNFTESVSKNYKVRTQQNVKDADATLLVGNVEGKGSKLTINTAEKLGKPILINPKTATELDVFLIKHNAKILNVAGTRGSHDKGGVAARKMSELIEGVTFIKKQTFIGPPERSTREISYGSIYDQVIPEDQLNIIIADTTKKIKTDPLFRQAKVIEPPGSKKSYGHVENEAMDHTEESLESVFMFGKGNVTPEKIFKTKVDVYPTSADFVTRSITKAARDVAQKGGTKADVEDAVEKEIMWFKTTAEKQQAEKLLGIAGQMNTKTTQSTNIKHIPGNISAGGANVSIDALPKNENFILEGLSGSRVRQLEEIMKSGKRWHSRQKPDLTSIADRDDKKVLEKVIADIKSGKSIGSDRLDILGAKYGSSGSSAFPLNRVRRLEREIAKKEAWDPTLKRMVKLTPEQIVKKENDIKNIEKEATKKTIDNLIGRAHRGNYYSETKDGIAKGSVSGPPINEYVFKNITDSTIENIGRYRLFRQTKAFKSLPKEARDELPETLEGFIKKHEIGSKEAGWRLYDFGISGRTDINSGSSVMKIINFVKGKPSKNEKEFVDFGGIKKKTYRERMVFDHIIPDKQFNVTQVDPMYYLGNRNLVDPMKLSKTKIKKVKQPSIQERVQPNIFRPSRSIFGTSRVQGSRTGTKAPYIARSKKGQRDQRFDVDHAERATAREAENKARIKLHKKSRIESMWKIENFDQADFWMGKKIKFGGL